MHNDFEVAAQKNNAQIVYGSQIKQISTRQVSVVSELIIVMDSTT